MSFGGLCLRLGAVNALGGVQSCGLWAMLYTVCIVIILAMLRVPVLQWYYSEQSTMHEGTTGIGIS